MAARNGKSGNGLHGANGQARHILDVSVLRDRATQVSHSATGIARITDQVAEGSDVQLRSLENALTEVEKMAGGINGTGVQAESLASSADSLASSINELGASIEQVSENTASMAPSLGDTAT